MYGSRDGMVSPTPKLEDLRRGRLGSDFESRKNKVFKSAAHGEVVVVKEFSCMESASKEYSILMRCHSNSIPVPRPISLHTDAITMEFVRGETVAEALDSVWLHEGPATEKERGRLRAIAAGLAKWLAEFHRLFEFRQARGDTITKNFLVSDGVIMGLDFEDASEEDVIIDLGQLCSSVLSMHPMFTAEKRSFCRQLSKSYFNEVGAARAADLDVAIAQALRHYASYRRDGDRMVAEATTIDREGFLSRDEG
jgi:tRNA A-37 threonylcarbamoyl transferase component Bud32